MRIHDPRRRLHPTRIMACTVVAAFALLGAACVPDSGTGGGTTTTTTTTTIPSRDLLCEFWNVGTPDPRTPEIERVPYVYQLDADTVLTAPAVEKNGADCTGRDSQITMYQASIVSAKMYLPKTNSQFPDGDEVRHKPEAYPLTLSAGQAQAPSIEIESLVISIDWTGLHIRGRLKATLNGAVSLINFSGDFQDLENFRVALSSPALSVPGVTTSPVSVTGEFTRTNGLNAINFTGRAPEVVLGDLTVTNASLDLTATTTSGIQADVRGRLAVGSNSSSVALTAKFDNTGQLVDLDGSLQVRLESTTSSNEPVVVDATMTINGSVDEIRATFAGSGVLGTSTISSAGGSIQVAAGGDVTLDGYFNLSSGGVTTKFEGQIHFGPSGAVESLSAVAAGTYTGRTAAGELVDVRGQLTTTVVNGSATVTIDGTLKVGTLAGTVSGTVVSSGEVTTISLAGNVVAGTIEAGVAGSVAFDGNELTSLQLNGSLNRPADVGGVEVQGQVAITGNSAGLSFTVTGLFRSATVDVSGSADIQLDAAGGIRRADVQARGLIRTSDFEMGAFNGVVRIRPDQVLAMGSMTVVGPGLLLGNANGYLIDDGHNPMLVLQGQGLIQTGNRFAVADFTIVNDDIQVARLALVYPPRLIDPERVWLKVTINSTRGCTNLQVLDSTFLISFDFNFAAFYTDLDCPRP